MHFIVSWDIKSQGKRRLEIDVAMKEGINRYSWVHPLETLYIIKVLSDVDWGVIRENLLTVADKFPGEVNFLMSPLFDGEADYFVYKIPDNDLYQNR